MGEDESLEGVDCDIQTPMDIRAWFRDYIIDQVLWSQRTFGDGFRTEGLTKHIEKELVEIKEKPHDLEEWIDVIILALDGAWRCGKPLGGGLFVPYTPDEIMDMLERKQDKNFNRTWNSPVDPTQPCEHVREESQP